MRKVAYPLRTWLPFPTGRAVFGKTTPHTYQYMVPYIDTCEWASIYVRAPSRLSNKLPEHAPPPPFASDQEEPRTHHKTALQQRALPRFYEGRDANLGSIKEG